MFKRFLVALGMATTVFSVVALTPVPVEAQHRLFKQGNPNGHPFDIFMQDSASTTGAGKTGLTLTVKISKDGAAAATPTGTVIEKDSTNFPGIYKYTPSAADMNFVGFLAVHATSVGAIDADYEAQVVPFDPDDTNFLGLVYLNQLHSALGSDNRMLVSANAHVSGLTIAAINGITFGGSVVPSVVQIAAAILLTPTNLLATDSSGAVKIQPAEYTAIRDAINNKVASGGTITKYQWDYINNILNAGNFTVAYNSTTRTQTTQYKDQDRGNITIITSTLVFDSTGRSSLRSPVFTNLP